MADIKQLLIVKEMASKKEQEQLRMLTAAQQQLNQLKQQMDSLIQYKKDYLRQMKPDPTVPVSADKLILLQGFLAKIDQSMNQQRDVIARASIAVDSRRQDWSKAKQYVDSIEFLINKQQQQHAEKEEKQQQKLSDEFAMMSYYRKNNPSS
ncbi:flagellar export protein FliJ [Psychrobium sp. 1_MG-2023]|uniref:flagellar export protein FliJ n=1 Tax=Psychrobium sp. 1_MG-2023 TaxID=3062624 RepID=UPI000C323714|nr:flagellar export protein FliJ [Psychrobium sp. 1_MG-2023]MDP2559834.1 flagellar export protein FliJ [Psychrobium sp. 1_MG-2023]PKF59062.1 flagellar export protein FliJ [Alteromonadales bacterium alter-6D02]